MKPNCSGRSPAAMISTTIDGLITSFDKTAEQLLGYRSEEIIGKHSPVMFHDVKELTRRAELPSDGKGHFHPRRFQCDCRASPSFILQKASGRMCTVMESGSRCGCPSPPCRMVPERLAGFLFAAQDLRDRSPCRRTLAAPSHSFRFGE